MSVCRFWQWPAWPCPCQRCLKSCGPCELYELYDSVDSGPVDSFSGGSRTPELAHLWQKPPLKVSPQSLLPWIRHCSNRLLGFWMDRLHWRIFGNHVFIFNCIFNKMMWTVWVKAPSDISPFPCCCRWVITWHCLRWDSETVVWIWELWSF